MNRHCYYVAADHRDGPRPSVPIEHSTRIYRSETRARQAAQIAEEDNHGHRFDVGSLTDIPDWATEVEELDHEVLHPDAVPDDDADIYAMRFRPATQFGTLPKNVNVARWTRVPRELAGRFPNHPVSKRPFGEFVASRRLTEQELRDYQIEQVN